MTQLTPQKLANLLSGLPPELSQSISLEYQDLVNAYLSRKWDDVQTIAGRFAEAILRVLEFHNSGSYTPIDGLHKPSRKTVAALVKSNTNLPASLRLQVPSLTELIMDFRNNRNSAHLGNIKPWQLDALLVMQMASWIVAELIRLESRVDDSEIQNIIDHLAELPSPVIQRVYDIPIVLDTSLLAEDKVLVLLMDAGKPLDMKTLFIWSEYKNPTRWQKQVLGGLARKKHIHIDNNDIVHLLRPGETRCRQILRLS